MIYFTILHPIKLLFVFFIHFLHLANRNPSSIRDSKPCGFPIRLEWKFLLRQASPDVSKIPINNALSVFQALFALRHADKSTNCILRPKIPLRFLRQKPQSSKTFHSRKATLRHVEKVAQKAMSPYAGLPHGACLAPMRLN